MQVDRSWQLDESSVDVSLIEAQAHDLAPLVPVPVVARRRDGTYARWRGHRIRTGRGEGSSGYASDEARTARAPGV